MILTYTCKSCGKTLSEEFAGLEDCEQKAVDYLRENLNCPECSVKENALCYLAAVEKRAAIHEKTNRVDYLISMQEPCLIGAITGPMMKLQLELMADGAVEMAKDGLLYSAKRLRGMRGG